MPKPDLLIPATKLGQQPPDGAQCVVERQPGEMVHGTAVGVRNEGTLAGVLLVERGQIHVTVRAPEHVWIDLSAPTVDEYGRESHVDFLDTALRCLWWREFKDQPWRTLRASIVRHRGLWIRDDANSICISWPSARRHHTLGRHWNIGHDVELADLDDDTAVRAIVAAAFRAGVGVTDV